MGQPKALLSVPVVEVPLAVHLATIFLDAGLDDVVITVPPPPDGKIVREALAPHLAVLNQSAPRIDVIENLEWDAGLIGSVRSALNHSPHDVDVLVFSPVDAPFTTAPLVSALAAKAAAIGIDAAIPVVDGNRGHPVAISQSLFLAVHAGPAPDGVRGLLVSANTADIEWSDEHVCRNVNTPRAWTEAAKILRDRLRGNRD